LRGHARTSLHATLGHVPELRELATLRDVRLDGDRLSATVDADGIGDAMTLLVPYGLSSLTVEPPSLESLFLELYESDPDDSAVDP
ncbi:MAG: ABC transporter, partial [Dietzia sp.]